RWPQAPEPCIPGLGTLYWLCTGFRCYCTWRCDLSAGNVSSHLQGFSLFTPGCPQIDESIVCDADTVRSPSLLKDRAMPHVWDRATPLSTAVAFRVNASTCCDLVVCREGLCS